MRVGDLPGARVIRISAGQVDSGVFAGFQVGRRGGAREGGRKGGREEEDEV